MLFLQPGTSGNIPRHALASTKPSLLPAQCMRRTSCKWKRSCERRPCCPRKCGLSNNEPISHPGPTRHAEQKLLIPRAPWSCHMGMGTPCALPGMLPEARRKGAHASLPCPQLPKGLGNLAPDL